VFYNTQSHHIHGMFVAKEIRDNKQLKGIQLFIANVIIMEQQIANDGTLAVFMVQTTNALRDMESWKNLLENTLIILIDFKYFHENQMIEFLLAQSSKHGRIHWELQI
jgi:hypothetical protein